MTRIVYQWSDNNCNGMKNPQMPPRNGFLHAAECTKTIHIRSAHMLTIRTVYEQYMHMCTI